MEHTRAINALAPFLALSKSATSPRAAADLVTQATSAQNTYVFAELLQTPAIQSLRSDTQYAGFYTLLELFAWGTLQDYKSSQSTLPPLSEVQFHKLRLLTLLALAASCDSSSQLTYSNLQNALSLETPRALENLVTDAIYADLLSGTLNPAQQTVIISSVAPLRDLAPGSVTAMVAELEAWSQRCDGVLQELETEIARVKTEATKRANREAETAAQIERAERTGGDRQGDALDDGYGFRGGRGAGKMKGADDPEDDAMDVDGGPAARKAKGLFGMGKKR